MKFKNREEALDVLIDTQNNNEGARQFLMLPTDLYDYEIYIQWSITEEEGSTDENPKWKNCFFLGTFGDPSVGIWPFEYGPLFDTEEDCAAWAHSHKWEIIRAYEGVIA